MTYIVPAMAQAPGTVTNEETYSQQFVSAVYSIPAATPRYVQPRTERASVWSPVILEAARQHGADGPLMVRVAECESGFKPDIKNAISTASGLFQFLDSTAASQAKKYGITMAEKNDPYFQIDLAARMIGDGGITHWNASRHCWISSASDSPLLGTAP